MHDDEQDTPETYAVDAVTETGGPAQIEIIDIGDGELSVAIMPMGETVAFTAEQVDELIDALRRANGGQ